MSSTSDSPAPEAAASPNGRRRVRGGGGRRRRLLLGLCVVVGLLLGVGGLVALLWRATPQERATHLHELGVMRTASGEPAEALVFFRRAVEEDPTRSESRRALLHCLVTLQLLDDADRVAEELLVHVPDDGFAHRHVAVRRLAAGDLPGALRAVESALADPAQRAPALRLRAELHLLDARPSAALADWSSAAEIDADEPRDCLLAGRVASVLALLSEDAELAEQARRWFERADTRAARHDDKGYGLVRVEAALRRGAFATARVHLDELPAGVCPPRLRASVLSAQGAHDTAEHVLRTALASDQGEGPVSPQSSASSLGVRAQLVQALLAAGRLADAGIELATLRELAPHDARTTLVTRAYALCSHLQSKPDDLLFAVVVTDPLALVSDCARIVAPFVSAPLNDDARTWTVAERRARLRWWAEPSLLPGNDDNLPLVAPHRERTQADLDALAALDVRDPSVSFWKAAMALSDGDLQLASAFVDLAPQAATTAPTPRLVRALVLLRTDRAVDAAAVARAVVLEHPELVLPRVILVAALRAAGDVAEARSEGLRARSVWPRDARLAATLAPLFVERQGDVDSRGATDEDDAAALVAARAQLSRGDVPRAIEIAVPLLTHTDHGQEARALIVEAFDSTSSALAQQESEEPQNAVVSIRRAQSLLLAGRPLRAETVLREAFNRQTAPTSGFALARLLASTARLDDGLAVLDDLAKRAPIQGLVALERSRVLILGGRREEAIQVLRLILGSDHDELIGRPRQRQAALSLLLHGADSPVDLRVVEEWIARGSAPDARSEPSVEDALVRGHLALRRGDLKLARTLVTSELERAPKHVEAQLLAAVIEARGGQLDEAEQRLISLLGTAPFHKAGRRLLARVRLGNGQALRRRGRTVKARASFLHAIGLADVDSSAVLALVHMSSRPSTAAADTSTAGSSGRDGLISLATTLERDHPLRAAGPLLRAFAVRDSDDPLRWLPPLREAYRRDPGDAIVFSALVDGLLAADAGAEARTLCESRCAQPDPRGLAHLLLGHVLERGGDVDVEGAQAAYRSALVRYPGNWGARHRLADLLIRANRSDEARELLNARRATAPDGSSRRLELGRLLERSGDPASAVELLRAAVADRPTYAARLALARSLRAAGETDAARTQIEDALQEWPEAPAAYFAWLALERATGGLAEFRTELERRVATALPAADPQASRRRANVLLLLGMLAEGVQDWNRAETHYRAALPLAAEPSATFAVIANNLAWTLGAHRGRPDEGLPLAKRALVAAPASGQVLDTLGRLLHVSGRYADALAVLERAVSARPESVAVRLHRADTRLALRQFEGARADYAWALKQHPERARAHGAPARLAELGAASDPKKIDESNPADGGVKGQK